MADRCPFVLGEAFTEFLLFLFERLRAEAFTPVLDSVDFRLRLLFEASKFAKSSLDKLDLATRPRPRMKTVGSVVDVREPDDDVGLLPLSSIMAGDAPLGSWRWVLERRVRVST